MTPSTQQQLFEDTTTPKSAFKAPPRATATKPVPKPVPKPSSTVSPKQVDTIVGKLTYRNGLASGKLKGQPVVRCGNYLCMSLLTKKNVTKFFTFLFGQDAGAVKQNLRRVTFELTEGSKVVVRYHPEGFYCGDYALHVGNFEAAGIQEDLPRVVRPIQKFRDVEIRLMVGTDGFRYGEFTLPASLNAQVRPGGGTCPNRTIEHGTRRYNGLVENGIEEAPVDDSGPENVTIATMDGTGLLDVQLQSVEIVEPIAIGTSTVQITGSPDDIRTVRVGDFQFVIPPAGSDEVVQLINLRTLVVHRPTELEARYLALLLAAM